MNASFYNGISGIVSSQYGMDVTSNNISNISTIGFKGSSTEFSSHFSSALSDSYFDSTTNDIGYGSKASGTALDMSQGIFQDTDNVFDLALGAEGWFGIQSQNNETLYTRAGNFSLDKNGDMVDANGNYLLGTSAGNITPTTLPPATMEEFGRYYNKNTNELGQANQIASVTNITLSSVEGQTKINLPEILYYPAEATSAVSFYANLDPEIIIGGTQIDLNSIDITSTIDTINQTITINGTTLNTPELQNPKQLDVVLITITDINGKAVEARASLDVNLNWVVNNEDISSLDTTNPLVTTAKLQTTQEIPNVEHFSSTVISPEGKKDILDMTYTKRVPQSDTENIWDGVIQILSLYETYDPSKTYDPTLYKVDESAGKVYKILDQQDSVLEFAGSGAILNATMPTMSNGGTFLEINVGEPDTFTGFTSNVALDRTRSSTYNGYVEGYLKDYGMDGNGNVIAEFSNGRSTPVAKIAVYHFQNDQGLESMGSTIFKATRNSGDPIFYTNENGETIQGSKIYSNKLENSNVNLATALTELIIMQKSFDSNSKSITTSDQMIQNAINMKV
ncbi:flagellar hook-basal body complex protein [Sulfurospirillum arcachonense]|uniref:flagellar hook-basal body complex protein n=1 Tax=Sulfurospirillum arcachonense TaxID=57666 RepID=UPI000467F029|nr:flagellar hook-basal body complex protein [Sulfurospirillum arcachonense]